MEIIKANKSHKNHVLELLDGFRAEVMKISEPLKESVSTTAKNFGGELFDKVIDSDGSAIFLAKDEEKYVGIATIYKIPQIRKGIYVGEIEEMYVDPAYQGRGIASLLMDAVFGWAKDGGVNIVRLESSSVLQRAHKFYEKTGFIKYGNAYEKSIG